MLTTAELAERIAPVLAVRPEILEAYLFGSCARGAATAHSDIDVAVFLDQGTTAEPAFGYGAHLTAELMAALGSNRVDVVMLNHAQPLLYHRVLRDGIRMVSRDLRATTAREGSALSRYCDFLPQLAKVDAALRDGAARKVLSS